MAYFEFTSKVLNGHRVVAKVRKGPDAEVFFMDLDSPGGSLKYHMDALCEEFIMARQHERFERTCTQ